MALGFLGGMGIAASQALQGYEHAEDRAQLAADREFQKSQRQRMLDEQKREDEFRKGMQGVQSTETVDETVTTPEQKTINGNPAAITRDDEGNMLPGAQEMPAQTTTQKVTRQRNKDDVLMDYANMARKSGKIDLALQFEDQADKASHARAAAMFQQWSASTPDSANLADVAQQAAKIYNSDRLPGKVKGITPNADGSVTVNMFNSASGQEIPRTFKSVAELKQGLESYFSPETYNAYIKSKRDAAIKAQEKLYEPYTLKPGEKRQVLDPTSGKAITIGQGDIPPGYEVMTDQNGNTILRKIDGTGGRGTGTGAGGKGPKEDIDAATTILKDALGKSDGTPEGAQRYTRAVSYLDGIYGSNPGIAPRTAAAIAADASANPANIKMQLGADGRVSKVYSNPDFEGGRQFNLAANSASLAEMEKSVGADGMKTAVTGMMTNMLAVVPEEQRATTQQQLIQVATNPQARQAYLAAAKEAGKDVDTLTRQLDLIAKYSPAGGQKTDKSGPGYAPDSLVGRFVAGLNYKPKAPDPNSQAGQYAARQAELAAQSKSKAQERAAAQQALSRQYQADKKTMSPEELVRKYQDTDLPVADLRDLRSLKY